MNSVSVDTLPRSVLDEWARLAAADVARADTGNVGELRRALTEGRYLRRSSWVSSRLFTPAPEEVLCIKFGLMFANVWPFGRPEGLTHLAQSSVLRGPIRFK